jgi:hypothetical protein
MQNEQREKRAVSSAIHLEVAILCIAFVDLVAVAIVKVNMQDEDATVFSDHSKSKNTKHKYVQVKRP